MFEMQEKIMRLFFNVSGRMRLGWRLVLFVISVFLFSILLSPLAYLWGWTFRYKGIPIEIKIDPWIVFLGVLLASIISVKYLDKRPLGSLGLKLHGAWWKEFFLGVCLGVFLFLLSSLLSLALAQQSSFKFKKDLVAEDLWSYFLSLIENARGAIGEELLFRGFPLQALIEGIGIVPALFVSSALFGLGHLQEQGWLGVVWAGGVGMLLAVSYLKTKALWMSIGVHFSWSYSVWLLERFIVLPSPSVPMVLADLAFFALVALLIWKLPLFRAHPEMEALWQQYVPIAQPWAHLKSWWATRKGQREVN